MWLMLGLFGGVIAIAGGLSPLGIAGILVGAICQWAQNKDEEVWEEVQDTPASGIFIALSTLALFAVAAVCFAIFGLGLDLTSIR